MDSSRPKFPWLYLILAYAFAWVFWIPIAWTGQDYQSSPVLLIAMLAGVFGPGLAAIVLVHLRKDKAARRDFWARAVDPRRIRSIWYLIAILLWPALHLITIAINALTGGHRRSSPWFANWWPSQPVCSSCPSSISSRPVWRNLAGAATCWTGCRPGGAH